MRLLGGEGLNRDLTAFQATAKVAAMKNRTGAAGLKLSWDEIGFICEGLALSSRPLRFATQAITQEYSLGPRGAWMVLLISTGEVYPLDLTKIFQVGRSLITAELNRLVDAGLITYQQSTQDGRRVQLALTPVGQKVLERVKADTAKLVLDRLKAYSREEILLCAKLLRDFRLPDTADAPAAYERVRIREAKAKARPKSKRAKRVAT